jgi:hypothetical protein
MFLTRRFLPDGIVATAELKRAQAHDIGPAQDLPHPVPRFMIGGDEAGQARNSR